MVKLPNGDVVLGPVGTGLLSLSVDRLVYEGGAPIDLPFGPGARFALLVSPSSEPQADDDTWEAAVKLDERPIWTLPGQTVFAVPPRSDSPFSHVRLESPVTLEPTTSRPLGLTFTTPAYFDTVGLALLDGQNHILSAIRVP